MQKFFCDKCGNECEATASTARTWSRLAETVTKLPLGLQVLPTYKDQVGQGHVCNTCFPELLILAAKTYKESDVVAKQSLMAADAKNYNAMKRILEKQLDMATQREKAAESQVLEASKCITAAEEQHISDLQEIEKLTAQVSSLKSQLETAVRIRNNASKQHEIDMKENPDYAKVVRKREQLA